VSTTKQQGGVMAVSLLFASAALVLPTGGIFAQERKPYPIFTAEHFVAAMKTVGQAFTAASGSLTRNDVDDAKAYLSITRDRLATTMTFWRDRRQEDAIRMLRTALTALDELDGALSTDPVDQTTVAAAAKQVGAGCDTCHAAYRDQDPATKAYRFKAGIP
jgi:cytochrome c556